MFNQKKDPKGYYEILAVSHDADISAIKSAFRRKAMQLHPDRNKAADAKAQFQLLNEAYQVLSDPDARADYDMTSFKESPVGAGYSSTSSASESKSADNLEPATCSCCGQVTAQPRYVIFSEVKSFLVVCYRSTRQGIFCKKCAARQAVKSSLVTWIFGWWSGWGLLFTIPALFKNTLGGTFPKVVNARLLAYQALYFAQIGQHAMAYAIALDAMKFAKKIRLNEFMQSATNSRGIEDVGVELRRHIQLILDSFGGEHQSAFRNVWKKINTGSVILGAPLLLLCGTLAVGAGQLFTQKSERSYYSADPITTEPEDTYQSETYEPDSTTASEPSSASSVLAEINPKTIEEASGNTLHAEKPTYPQYVRPLTAPNGVPWPKFASYISGYAVENENGYSKVTIDNQRNNSDVFVKLMALKDGEFTPVRYFYIPAFSRFTLKDITAGEYDIRYRDLDTGSLAGTDSFDLTESTDDYGTRYSTVTLTLYKVENGNMEMKSLSEDQF